MSEQFFDDPKHFQELVERAQSTSHDPGGAESAVVEHGMRRSLPARD